jgi:hypothetical protein
MAAWGVFVAPAWEKDMNWFFSKRTISLVVLVLLVLLLAIFVWPRAIAPGPEPADKDGKAADKAGESAKAPVNDPKLKALQDASNLELREYVAQLKNMDALTQECILLKVLYEEDGRNWNLAQIEKAEKKVDEVLALQDFILQRLKNLEQNYAEVFIDGKSMREHSIRHQEGVMAKKTAALERKRYWEEAKKNLKK